jgi:hypothetical protein
MSVSLPVYFQSLLKVKVGSHRKANSGRHFKLLEGRPRRTTPLRANQNVHTRIPCASLTEASSSAGCLRCSFPRWAAHQDIRLTNRPKGSRTTTARAPNAGPLSRADTEALPRPHQTAAEFEIASKLSSRAPGEEEKARVLSYLPAPVQIHGPVEYQGIGELASWGSRRCRGKALNSATL